MKRILKYIAINILIISIFLMLLYIKFNSIANKLKYEYIQAEYTISQGETLFEIAKNNCKGNLSINCYIDYILTINNLKNSTIYENQKIKILIKK